MTAKKDTRFRKGESGNPAGRPPGASFATKAREELQRAWSGELADGSDGVRAKLLELARAGDIQAMRLVAERVCPPLKAAEQAVGFPIPEGTLTERAAAVLGAVGSGALAVGEAAQLIQAIGSLAKLQEVDELARRIEALEKQQKEIAK